MSKIARIGASPRNLGKSGNALERRTARIEQRLLATQRPIVWLNGMAGCGKTWLMDHLGPALIHRGWRLVDEPTPADLGRELGALQGPPLQLPYKLLIASRPDTTLAALLLRHRAYGMVDELTDAALFVQPDDATAGEASLLLATGGWPWLCAAALSGREAAARELLPEFLEREVLPHLGEGTRAALCAASSLPPAANTLELQDTDCFFVQGSPDGPVIRGDWVKAALHSLRRSPTLRTAGVRERLMRCYQASTDPVPAIEAFLGLGDEHGAFELFRRAGGAHYGYQHGFHALERVLELFGPELTERSEDLFLARLWMLLKTGKTREALLRLEARYPGLPVDLRRLRLSHRPDLLLLRADMANDLDATPPLEVIASWGRVQAFMAPGDELSRGLLYNAMAIGYLQADAIVEARQMAEESLAAYIRAGLPYLVHFMHVHLADIALRQSHLADAARHLASARECLAVSGQAFNSEYAIIGSLKSRLEFEQGCFADCSDEIQPLLDILTTGDSWPDLIPRAVAQVSLAALWRGGLRAAIDQLDRCDLAQRRRHGTTAHLRLRLIRIRVMQAARRHAEAAMLLEEYDLVHDARPSSALEVELGLIRLRQSLHQDRAKAQRVRLCDSLAQHPALEMRQRVTLAVLLAAVQQKDGSEAAARRHLRIALREAQTQGLVAVLIEDGEFLERLLPAFIASPGPGTARLAAFGASILKILEGLGTAPLRSKALAGLSRQEHRVLSYVADGYSNKHTARALNVSESTVKFHLRSLFRKLKVSRRASLAEAARDRGILT